MKTTLKEKIHALNEIFDKFVKEKVHRLFIIWMVIITLFGMAVYFFEYKNSDSLIKTIGDGIWWGFVTITTVGYGDKFPVTWPGRIIAIFMMGSGMVLTIIISGTIASILVERKMKEGKGLQKVTATNHTIICGWNENGYSILEDFRAVFEKTRKKSKIVLINELEIDSLDEIQFTYNSKYLNIDFIRGNFTHEQVLEKSNINKASTVLLLADESGTNTKSNADERTILAAYTIRNTNPGIKINAQLINANNEQYLKQTNIDNILIDGELNSFLLVNAAIYTGVPKAIKEILSFNLGNEITVRPIPVHFQGRNFADLSNFFREKENSILIGVMSESKKLSIGDFLSDDPSAIDDFIKRKFAESESDFFADTGGKMNVMVNPGWNYVISDADSALVIGEVKEK